MTKKAGEFVEELVLAVDWIESTAIVLKEKIPAGDKANWHATTGPLSPGPAQEFSDYLAANEDRVLDWQGVEREVDGMRTVVRWVAVRFSRPS
jgi:hypothetical protein